MSQASQPIFELSPKRRALLEVLLREEGLYAAQPHPIPRRDPAEPVCLSFAQQRLWFIDQLVPNNPFYNIPAAVRLIGSLNVAALQRSLAQLVQRHEILRISFATIDGRPVQVIADRLPHPS